MTEPKVTQDYSEQGEEIRRFYAALGKFNASKIATITRDTTLISRVTDEIISCTSHGHDCGPGMEWDHVLMACVKIAADPTPD